ncbi:capsular biosynthesis protein [Limibaculum sp. M0105]|uniref:Capsular biosynthesis protein n=1 Tax=Thermohalobaculum xanthum TaxID=2753746 RepID=A0A8J7M7F8_9RHOB|nr:capsular biosynthesis protein [Thermohalobaculum xanthum]MBK0399986.1 capsular biosynthesis protein [Thermohalobaculum xanthum]
MNQLHPLDSRSQRVRKVPDPDGALAGTPSLQAGPGSAREQTVLMLQGPASGFWSVLGSTFTAAGMRLIHVNLALGDWLFWRAGGKRLNYRGRLEDWEHWLEALVEREGVTDILYFGDRLPYHQAAQRIALRREGLRVWAVENGYLRPNWITLEPFAMGRHSRFTRDPETLRYLAAEAAEKHPEAPSRKPAFGHPFAVEAFCEVTFNLAQVFGRVAFPRYFSDKAVWPVVEYLGWLPRIWNSRKVRRHARRVERDFVAGKTPSVLVALQLETDYQIRASSDYTSQREMLEEVITSFARSAPGDMRLVIKVHPFDPGLINWGKVAARIASRAGVAGRVATIRGGNLTAMTQAAHGVITTNSTSGVLALSVGCPVRVMGDAVYDIEGLTHRGPLDQFWTAPQRPDPELFDAWSRAAAAWIQMRGSLFDPRGQRAAAREIVERVRNHRHYWQTWRDPAAAGASTPCAPAAVTAPSGRDAARERRPRAKAEKTIATH